MQVWQRKSGRGLPQSKTLSRQPSAGKNVNIPANFTGHYLKIVLA